MKQECGNCRFGCPMEQKDTTIIVCLRFPPVPVLTPGENFDPGDTLQGFWPRCSPEDVCGEWKMVRRGSVKDEFAKIEELCWEAYENGYTDANKVFAYICDRYTGPFEVTQTVVTPIFNMMMEEVHGAPTTSASG